MKMLMLTWELASYYKLGNDLSLILQGCKNPLQVFIESGINDYAKRFAYNSLNYNNSKDR